MPEETPNNLDWMPVLKNKALQDAQIYSIESDLLNELAKNEDYDAWETEHGVNELHDNIEEKQFDIFQGNTPVRYRDQGAQLI